MTPLSIHIVTRMTRYWLIMLMAILPLWSRSECLVTLPALDKLEAIVYAEMTARDALVTIRRNAQDWKNLLLRGSDAQLRQLMQNRFDTQAATYEVRLGELRKQMQALGENSQRLDILDSERAQLFGKYRGALSTHGVNTLEAAFRADKEAQGADIKTLRTLEETIEFLAVKNREQFQIVRQLMQTCNSQQMQRQQK
jgi:hypothetical protein